jgi:hypothetical protein
MYYVLRDLENYAPELRAMFRWECPKALVVTAVTRRFLMALPKVYTTKRKPPKKGK